MRHLRSCALLSYSSSVDQSPHPTSFHELMAVQSPIARSSGPPDDQGPAATVTPTPLSCQRTTSLDADGRSGFAVVGRLGDTATADARRRIDGESA